MDVMTPRPPLECPHSASVSISKNSIRANAAAFAEAIRTTADLDHPRRKLHKVIFNAELAMATWTCFPPSRRVHRHTASHPPS